MSREIVAKSTVLSQIFLGILDNIVLVMLRGT